MRKLFAFIVLAASSVLWAAGSAIITLEMPIGARQLGMGEVGAAIADDATALYYNPAGLAFGPLADEWRMSYPEKSEKSPYFTKIAARTRPGFFAKSELWTGTSKGIMRFDGERWLNFHSVLLDGNMKIRDVVRVFVGTERGLDEYTRQVKKFNNVKTADDESRIIEVRIPWDLVIKDTVTALLYEPRTEKLW
ncbi:MAG TPA: regulator, partial [Fibrobacteraceae bacterium]|nr:regulator [Fibrobacteraceae bacterium]